MKKEDEPQVDESLLTEGQKRELQKTTFNKKWAIFWGVLGVLIITCIIVIVVLTRVMDGV